MKLFQLQNKLIFYLIEALLTTEFQAEKFNFENKQTLGM